MKTTLKTIGIAFLGGSLALAGYSYIAPNKEIIIQKTETPILAQPVNIPVILMVMFWTLNMQQINR
jgi:hypothetical protein